MKRIFDFSLSLIGLIVVSPILILITLAVRLKLGSPVFFKQKRPGLNGQIFTLVKFRTMKVTKNTQESASSDEERITKFGAFLRKTSLDELPELLNVLKGEMSLVGPRPLLVEYLPLYNEFQSRRHNVRPGITGWAQINGRNAISWEEKFKLDVWYVENRSLFLDIKILLLTIKKVISRDGVSANDHATMPPFTGNKL
ncbi:MAG: sugar transferase [Lentisphaeraceae bacterium]|nr:sugar transferase [Lentisphaeraceae bacterium]